MNCPNCKKEIKDGSKFCVFCGANLQQQNVNTNQNAQAQQPNVNANQNAQAQQPNVNTNQNAQVQQPNVNAQQNNMPQPSQLPVQNVGQPQNFNAAPVMQKPKKPLNKKLLFGIIGGVCALLIIVVVAIVLVATHKTKINLNDYITVEFTGYNTNGEAEVDFDYTSYYDDLIKASPSFKNAYNGSYSGMFSAYYDMVDSVDWELDESSGLKNGDVVTVTFEFDNEAASKFKIEYAGEPTEYTVEGLKEVKTIDPFDGVTVEFTGTSPDVRAEVKCTNTDEVYDNIYYDLSKSYEIKVGDKITVTVTNDPEYFIEEYGCAFTTTTKEFECKGVDQYVSKVADIKPETLDSMKTQTEDVINSYFAGDSKYISLSDLKFEGTYFLYAKDGAWTWNGKNQLYVIYSGKVKSNEEKKQFDETTVYFPVRFTDIMQYADGTQYVDLKSNSIEGETTLKYGYYSEVKGYTSKADMYNDLVVSKKADYTEEITEGLK